MTLASRLAAGETLFTAWSGVPDSLTVEILAAQPFDAVTLDMQHGGHHEDSVLRGLLPVLRAGQPCAGAHSGRPLRHGEPGARFRRGGGDRADGQFGRGCAPLCGGDEISAGRRALMGPDLCLPAPRQGRFRRLARRIERPHAGLRHDRDARRARRAGRHSGDAGHRRRSSSARRISRSPGRTARPSTRRSRT